MKIPFLSVFKRKENVVDHFFIDSAAEIVANAYVSEMIRNVAGTPSSAGTISAYHAKVCAWKSLYLAARMLEGLNDKKDPVLSTQIQILVAAENKIKNQLNN